MKINPLNRYSLVVLWFFVTVCALWFVSAQRAIEFDPDALLQQPTWTEKALAALPQLADGPTLYLVFDQHCKCNKVGQEHRTKVIGDAKQANIGVVHVALSDSLSALIPAVPAALLLNTDREVIYAGPLSVGLACAISDGIIDTVIANFTQGFASNLRVSDTRGCYCRSQ